MQPNSNDHATLAGHRYTNVLLTLIALSLGVIAFDSISANPSVAGAAWAQPGDDDEGGRISAAEQRKQIIAELKSMGARLERLDTQLQKGINVKVTEMPRTDAEKK